MVLLKKSKNTQKLNIPNYSKIKVISSSNMLVTQEPKTKKYYVVLLNEKEKKAISIELNILLLLLEQFTGLIPQLGQAKNLKVPDGVV